MTEKRAFKKSRKVRAVLGFKVPNQGRTKIRSELTGTYDGFDWIIFPEGAAMFQWRIGPLMGYSGPTLADVLRTMKKATKITKKLRAEYGGSVPDDQLNLLSRLLRWERRILEGRLEMTQHGDHWRVRELPR